GFTAVAFVGVKAVMDQAKDYVFSSLGGVPAQWLQVLGLLQVEGSCRDKGKIHSFGM
ncbi:hypothetical protein CJU07_34475, partial [Pseudomonas aeruginosa]